MQEFDRPSLRMADLDNKLTSLRLVWIQYVDPLTLRMDSRSKTM